MQRTRMLATFAAVALLALPVLFAGRVLAEDKEGGPDMSGPKPGAREDGPPRRQFDGKPRPGGRMAAMQDMMEDLNLTEAQKAKFHESMAKHHTAMKEWHEKHATELEAIDKQMQELHAKRRELMKDAPKPDAAMQEARASLTAEQQEKLDANLKEMRSMEGRPAWGQRSRGEGDRPRGGPGGPDREKKQEEKPADES